MNEIMCGNCSDSDIDNALKIIDQGIIKASEDHTKVEAIKAFAFASVKRFEEARKIFDKLIGEKKADASTVIHFSGVLINLGEPLEAFHLLEEYHKIFSDNLELLHRLASISFQLRNIEKAIAYFTKLIELHPQNRQYRFDAAHVFWHNGDRKRAQDMVAPLLDRNICPLPKKPEDYFYDGFANWILNRKERANYDFERSGKSPHNHYSYLLSI